MKIFILLFPLLLNSCTAEPDANDDDTLQGTPELTINTILTGYQIIWGMDFLPNGDLLFTEKQGKIYRKSGDNVVEITGFPEVLSTGQGGLLDIKAHPGYADNGWVYASYAASDPAGGGQLRLVRFRIGDDRVQDLTEIFRAKGPNSWYGHYGSRIVFDKDKYLFLSIGEGGSTSYGGASSPNNNAQDIQSPWGKIHRLNDDGTIPEGNPLLPGNSGPTSIFSYGHRNPQGLLVHPETGVVWSTEHGPRGGDEVNIITAGANYGWPLYSVGVNYDGTEISDSHTAPGITPPHFTWTPSIGTCGMDLITSDSFLSWKGNILVSGLASQKLHMCKVENGQITGQEVVLSDYGRVRDVIQAPDGSIYVSVENPGRIIRISAE
jgi:glucose/arabinose dehydrogenase